MNLNGDFDIWRFGPKFTPLYFILSATHIPNPSSLTLVIIRKLKNIQKFLFLVTVTLILDISTPYSIPL